MNVCCLEYNFTNAPKIKEVYKIGYIVSKINVEYKLMCRPSSPIAT